MDRSAALRDLFPTPRRGKLFFAANPWPLAAEAQRQGYPTDRFRESDHVPDGQVIVADLDAIFELPENWKFDA